MIGHSVISDPRFYHLSACRLLFSFFLRAALLLFTPYMKHNPCQAAHESCRDGLSNIIIRLYKEPQDLIVQAYLSRPRHLTGR
jgi:hypothetical protein